MPIVPFELIIGPGKHESTVLRCFLLAIGLTISLLPAAAKGGPPDPVYRPERVSINPGDPLSEPSSLSSGKLLVATRNIKDPRFSETVILLVHHGPDGSMGLIINRPSHTRLSEALPGIQGLDERTDALYFGGPVSSGQVGVLFQSSSRTEGSVNVFEDIFLSGSLQVLNGLIAHPATEERFRVYTGYAGWAPGQLEKEVLRGDWYILPADAETVFVKDYAGIWHQLIERVTSRWRAQISEDANGRPALKAQS